jgi:hypothetical protein
MFSADKLLAPAVVAFSSGIFGFLAYREPSTSTSVFRLFSITTGLLLSTIPYSLLTLEPINQKLESKASSLAKASISDASAEAGIAKEENTHYLVDRWATFNLGRTVLSGAAAILATWATVSRGEVVGLRWVDVAVSSGADRMGQ